MKRFVILLALIVGVGCIALPVTAQVRKAEKALKKQQYEEALSFADQALAKKPEDAKAFEVKGRIYQGMASMADGDDYTALYQHRRYNAMKRFVILLALIVGVGCIALPVTAQVRKAEKALKKQQYEEALSFADQALAKKPEDAKAFEVKGRIYQGMASMADGDDYTAYLGQMKEAFAQAASLNPKLAEKIQNQITLAYLGEFQNGIDAFNAAQTASDDAGYVKSAKYFEGSTIIEPDSTGPYVNWAFAMIGAGKEVDAIEPFQRAIEQGKPDAEVYSYLARIYLTNERADDAVPLLEDATKHFPDNVELQDMQLNAYSMAGQMERAIEVYGKTVEDNPDNKIYRYNYGSLLLQADKHDEAIAQLKEAVRIDDVYIDAQYNLGAAYVNKAVLVNTRINEIDDDLRANKSSLSAEEVSAKETEMDKLGEERRELFELAVSPLEKAKTLGEADGREVQAICQVLFQSYVQTGETEKAETIQECAGY